MCEMQPLCRSMKGASTREGAGGYDGAHRGGDSELVGESLALGGLPASLAAGQAGLLEQATLRAVRRSCVLCWESVLGAYLGPRGATQTSQLGRSA
jgi:hypothetical protein